MAPVAQNMVRTTGALVWQGLHLPVGVPLDMGFNLGTRLGTVGEASVRVNWMNSAGPAFSGPVFELPASRRRGTTPGQAR